jgi:hypothetical protein
MTRGGLQVGNEHNQMVARLSCSEEYLDAMILSAASFGRPQACFLGIGLCMLDSKSCTLWGRADCFARESEMDRNDGP